MKTYLKLVWAMVLFNYGLSTAQEAASDFLKSLNTEQLAKAQLTLENPLRENWHFFPWTMFQREGVPLSELNSTQKTLLHRLLKQHLSVSGYEKTLKIMALEDVLLEMGSNPEMRDSEKYYITFYGDPEKDAIWSWSFEGHHISLNFAVTENVVSFAPRFLGASPAIIPQGKKKGERTLEKEQDLALELINAMSPSQSEKAIFRETAFDDIISFTASKVEPMKTVGIPMAQLEVPQQELLLGLIYEYISVMPDDLAQKRMDKLKAEKPEDIHFGWAGATALGKPHYYRIQGKSFLIEFDNTQNNANHIHSVWRDFNGDFGRDLIREHYNNSGHHK
ncbi:MAG: DUF3500 domain-containing protein [Bacteroidota bacterium]